MKFSTGSLFVFAAAALAGNAVASTGVGVFVAPARTVGDLLSNIQSSRSALDRYTQYFQMTPNGVMKYFGALHTQPLARAGLYVVYAPNRNGKFDALLMSLPKGELIFVNAQNEPVLLGNGDPMTVGPSASVQHPSTSKGHAVNGGATIDAHPALQAVQGFTESTVLVGHTNFEDTELADSGLIEQPLSTSAAAGGAYASGGSSVSTTTIVLAAAGVAGIVLLATDHGSSSSSPHKTTTPVPEPMTLVVLGGGVAALATRRKKA